MDIKQIKFDFRIEEVIGRHITLKRQGTEMVGNCPFHNDHHASMKVNPVKQIFKCFACGESGDMFDFFTKQSSLTTDSEKLREAATIITGGLSYTPPPVSAPPAPIIEWHNAIPDQNNLPDAANLTFKDYGKPSNFWTYRDASGNVIGYTLRFDLPDGKKDVIPYTYKTDGKISKWGWKGLDIPRLLYNLPELYERPSAIVLVVEGEKACDAAKKLFPQYVCISWVGGKDNVKSADWTPLAGRNVYLWGDNDLPGVLAMFGGWELNDKTGIYKRFKGVCEYVQANFKRIKNSIDFPKKWDVADADWTQEQAAEYIKQNRDEIPAVSEHAPNELPEPISVVPSVPEPVFVPPVPELPEPEELQEGNVFFKPLGFENVSDSNMYVFFVHRTNVIVKLSPSGMTISNLLQLAPLNYWEGMYPKKTKSSSGPKYEITMIADHLMNVCMRIGIFEPEKIRGRGAWIDNGIPVIHCGGHLIVGGKQKSFSRHHSEYIYEAGRDLGFELTKPMNKLQANEFIKILERLNWGREINARLLAGWIVIAPLCGALHWRSHIWLTGSSGSGKSWIMNNVIKKFMGNMFVDAQGATTEAGIRQYLRNDALAVVFDEAESEDKKGVERIQSILEIVRASSTSDGGKIIKGSSGGAAAQFNIRSCFAFASIGAHLTQRSDISRITVLELKKDIRPDAEELWGKLLEEWISLIDEEYIKRFQSRSVSLLPIILQNAKIFSNAAALELKNQRTGDQLGALLAGAYSLYSDSVITMEKAREFITECDWTEERLLDSTRDEVKVLRSIVESETVIESPYGRFTRTIGELIINARGDVMTTEEAGRISEQLASDSLKRLGILVTGYDVFFSENSKFIKRCVPPSWQHGYSVMLQRIDESERVEGIVFGSGIKSIATKIDSRMIFGEYKHPGMVVA